MIPPGQGSRRLEHFDCAALAGGTQGKKTGLSIMGS